MALEELRDRLAADAQDGRMDLRTVHEALAAVIDELIGEADEAEPEPEPEPEPAPAPAPARTVTTKRKGRAR